jgi:polyphosphate glucokinase
MSKQIILGIDIGGSFLKSAPVDLLTGKLTAEPFKVATPTCAEPVQLVNVILQLLQHFDWTGQVGIGFPGVVREGIVRTAVHLHPDWVGLNIRALLKPLARTGVSVLNDADAAGLAEMAFGAGRDEPKLTDGTTLLITLGTGIGSALFRHRRLIPNTEFGHIYMENGEEAEAVASASLRTTFNLSWEEFGLRVDRYLKYVDRLVAPDLMIVGGGVSEEWEQFSPFLSNLDRIRPARLGNSAGLIGAALYRDYISLGD